MFYNKNVEVKSLDFFLRWLITELWRHQVEVSVFSKSRLMWPLCIFFDAKFTAYNDKNNKWKFWRDSPGIKAKKSRLIRQGATRTISFSHVGGLLVKINTTIVVNDVDYPENTQKIRNLRASFLLISVKNHSKNGDPTLWRHYSVMSHRRKNSEVFSFRNLFLNTMQKSD